MHGLIAVFLSLSGAIMVQAAPAPQLSSSPASVAKEVKPADFIAFSDVSCGSYDVLSFSTQSKGNGEICFTLDGTAASFAADTPGITLYGFPGADCEGTGQLLPPESRECTENLNIKSVLQTSNYY